MAFDLSAKRELNKGFGDALAVAVELAVTPADLRLPRLAARRVARHHAALPARLLPLHLHLRGLARVHRYQLRMEQHEQELLGPEERDGEAT